MKLKFCILTLLAVLVVSAEDKQATKKTSAKKVAAPPAAVTLPAAAVPGERGTYTFTDEKGNKWIYFETPFGLAKREDKPAEPTKLSPGAVINAFEDGDKIRFERPGPFGTYRWEKKKSDLDADERAAWEKSKAKKE
jgi:hypothetical protein